MECRSRVCESYAPIPTGHRWGLVLINRDLHMNFDLRGGVFDPSPQFVRMAAKKVLVSWQSLGGPERSRVVTFIGGRKELFSDVFRNLLS